jgi:uncharacterized protein
MNFHIKIVAAIACALMASVSVSRAQDKSAYLSTADSTEDKLGTFPHRQGSVNDFEKLLTAHDAAELTSIIQKHKEKTGNEIVVITTKSYAPYPDITYYAKDLAIVWGVGKTKNDNGLMVMLSKKQGLVQLVPGEGLRGALTDTICGTILDKQMLGSLEKAQYGEALIAGVRECVRVLEK